MVLLRSIKKSKALRLLGTMPIGLVLWLMLWVNIDSGPWYLRNPSGLLGYLHAARTLLPFAAIILAWVIIARRQIPTVFSWASPVRLMTLFGVVALFSSLFSPRPLEASYWGSLYLSVFIVLEAVLVGPDSLKNASQLLVVNWIIVSLYAVALIIIGRHELFGEGGRLIGYGIIHRIPVVVGATMSRSSGISRFAAIPATIAFCAIVRGKKTVRFLWLIPFFAFTAVIITMQSRGSILGFAAAICFVLLTHRSRLKMLLLVVAILVASVCIDNAIPDRTVEYIYRGQDRVEFLTLSGRTRTWARGWELFKESPLLGSGPLADRYSLHGEHMHNAYLYALVQSGILGTIPFVAAWLVTWLQLINLLRRRYSMEPFHKELLIQAGAVLVFFTVRSVPESSAAFYGVDLLIMLPVLAYFHILHEYYKIPLLAKTRSTVTTRRIRLTPRPYRLRPFRR